MNKRETQAKIQRGVRKLDKIVPRWRQLIDLEELDLSQMDCCPLGQVFGCYEKGLDVLDIDYVDADDCGFGLHDNGPGPGEERYERDYAKLTRLWREALASDRNTDGTIAHPI